MGTPPTPQTDSRDRAADPHPPAAVAPRPSSPSDPERSAADQPTPTGGRPLADEARPAPADEPAPAGDPDPGDARSEPAAGHDEPPSTSRDDGDADEAANPDPPPSTSHDDDDGEAANPDQPPGTGRGLGDGVAGRRIPAPGGGAGDGDEGSTGESGPAGGGEDPAGSFGVDVPAEQEMAVAFGGFWELARNIDRIEQERVDGADEVAVAEDPGEPPGPELDGPASTGSDDAGRPQDGADGRGGFWDLAKKGLAAWGHEPSVEEMVGYWRGLIDDIRTAELDDGSDAAPVIGLASTPPPTATASPPKPRTGDGEPAPAAARTAPPLHPEPPDRSESAWSPAPAACGVSRDARRCAQGGQGPTSPPPGFLDRRRTTDRPPNPVADPLVALGGEPAAATWVGADAPPLPAGAIRLDGALKPATVDLEDTIELDELVELAGLADMAVLTDPTCAPHRPGPAAGGPDHPTPGPDTEPTDQPSPPGPDMTVASPTATTTPDQATATPDDGHPAGPRTGAPPDQATSDRADAAAEAGRTAVADDGPGRPLGLAGGGLAFAGSLALVDRRRRAQQRHRPAGRQIAMPAVPLDAYERELRHGADRATAGLVDLALRAAAAGSPDSSLPPLRWVEVSPDGVTLVLDAARPAPPGFAVAGKTAWATIGTPDDLAARAAPALPPVRALVPLGGAREGRDGHELLIDLESTGIVTVDGPADDVRGLLRAATVALATAPWADPLEVIVVGLDPELEALPGIRAVDDLATALALAEAHVKQLDGHHPPVGGTLDGDAPSAAQPPGVHPNPPDAGGRHGSGSRSGGPGAGRRPGGPAVRAWPQEGVGESLVIVSAVAAEDRAGQERIAALGRRSRRGLGLLLRRSSESRIDGRDARRLHIDGDGRLRGDGIEGVISARRLDEVETTALVALLDIAHRDAHGPVLGRTLDARRPAPTTAGGSPPPAGEQGSQALDDLLADVDVLVRVLGEVEAVRLSPGGRARTTDLAEVRADGDPPVQRDADDRADRRAPGGEALEVVTFLALSASPVSYGSLQVNLCVEGADAAGAVDEAIEAARRFLGDDLLPAPTRGRYALSERVVTDYGILGALLARAEATEAEGDREAATQILAAAVELVRGPPLSGPGRGYAWAGPQREAMVARVVDLAERLAERRLAAGDWDGAEAAARRGLTALPCDERLHRALMRSAHGRGDVDLVHQVFEELCDAIADPDTGVEPDDTLHPETVELLEQLVARRPRRPRQPVRSPEIAGDLAPGRSDDDHLAA